RPAGCFPPARAGRRRRAAAGADGALPAAVERQEGLGGPGQVAGRRRRVAFV
ncbi:hypothetical protein MNEG_14501, partial [Monoraphidium neglectum]